MLTVALLGMTSVAARPSPDAPEGLAEVAPAALPAQSPTVWHRVNAGGPSASGTPAWAADTSSAPSAYSNAAHAWSTTYSTSATINTSHPSLPAGIPASVLQSERYDPAVGAEMQWRFPVTPGTYEVRLYFAELYFTKANQRVFNVAIENTLVLSRYDIVADVGAFKGVMKSFVVTSDATLDIAFGHVIENPKISAIEILDLSTTSPEPAPPPPTSPTSQETIVSIHSQQFLLNGMVTHPGTAAEGLLLNSRMAQAVFDDENSSTVGNWRYPDTGAWSAERNVTEFIAALPSYAAKGLRAVAVNFQGGTPGWSWVDNQPGIITAFNADGTMKPAWLNRMDRVIRAADQHGIVVILGLFYFGQDHRLANETAILRAVDGVTDWLLAQGYTNVLVEINNEADYRYNHAILQPARVAELITRVRQRSFGQLKVSTSFAGGTVPPSSVISASDYILLHGNNQSASSVASMVDKVRATAAYHAKPKPIVFNEDSTSVANLDAAVSKRASWGYYDQGSNNYKDGFQSPPVRWTINTTRKQAFFDRVTMLTGTAGSPSSGDQRVVSFTLINADTNQPVAGFETLTGGVTLNLATLPTRRLNLRANTSPAIVGSVRFGLNSNPAYRIESGAPYALAGDEPVGNYLAWSLGLGTSVVTATPYSGAQATGSAGTALTLTMTIVDDPQASAPSTSEPPPPSGELRVVDFTLINADTDQPISGFDKLTGGEVTLRLSQLPTRNLNLRANTSPSTVGSVRFGLNSNATYRIESGAPYALAGDTPVGDYQPWSLGTGSYVVTASPYSGTNASGTAGSSLSVTLKIVQ